MRRALTRPIVLFVGIIIASTAAAQPVKRVEYYHLDALGSVRAVTDQQGHEIARHDYLPFGEEWPQATFTLTPLFIGKQRDAESALDYVGARYYAGRMGGFTTVDPEHVNGNVYDPQSWNAYAYARNNPLRFIDPDGRRWFTKNGEAVWVDPNKDGTYTSPGDGWVELDPQDYDYGMNVAFVNGTMSFIGEDPSGRKMLAPWGPPEQGLEDTTFSLLGKLMVAGSAVRAGAGAIMAARAPAAVSESTRLMTQAAMTVGNKGAVATGKDVALQVAEKWVGPGARVIRSRSGQIVGKISADGQRVYRITSLNKAQPYINLESKATAGNLHIRW